MYNEGWLGIDDTSPYLARAPLTRRHLLLGPVVNRGLKATLLQRAHALVKKRSFVDEVLSKANKKKLKEWNWHPRSVNCVCGRKHLFMPMRPCVSCKKVWLHTACMKDLAGRFLLLLL